MGTADWKPSGAASSAAGRGCSTSATSSVASAGCMSRSRSMFQLSFGSTISRAAGAARRTASICAAGALASTLTFTHRADAIRSEEHTSELQSLMRISYAVFRLQKKTNDKTTVTELTHVEPVRQEVHLII